jgi:hypothetical protein
MAAAINVVDESGLRRRTQHDLAEPRPRTNSAEARTMPAMARAIRLAIAAVLLVSTALASVVDAADPGAISRDAGNASGRPFTIDLYREGDFVSQANLVQCVGASMQMMLNMIGPTDDRTVETQKRLFDLARASWSASVMAAYGAGDREGAAPTGWAVGLNVLGAGPYRVTSTGTLDEAVRLAAVGIRSTGRPVGLLVWHGAHAWVMSGFEATGDPAVDPGAVVTAVVILDPLYPRTTRSHGRAPGPGTRLSIAALSEDYVGWRRAHVSRLTGRYVLVLPYRPLEPSLGSRPS